MTNYSRQKSIYDVIIVGGGIIGASTLYTLSRYTNISSIAFLEKKRDVGLGVSNRAGNSQTLHFGDIETNYTYEKAKKVKNASSLLAGYIEKRPQRNLYRQIHKMVIGVGKEEEQRLIERAATFSPLFPDAKIKTRNDLKEIEPALLNDRDPNQPICALYTPDGHTVDFGAVTRSFVDDAHSSDTHIDTFCDSEIESVSRRGDMWKCTDQMGRTYRARVVVMAIGAASLRFAHQLNINRHWILVPVAGSFFCAPHLVDGKVYTMQIEGIPFAAVHADPSVERPDETQFGPIAKVIPMLERHEYNSVIDFFKLVRFRISALIALFSLLFQKVYIRYILKQILYDIPYLGRWAFLSEARKITPSIQFNDLSKQKRHGGIRPQILDINKRALAVGEAKIVHDNIIFDITPSPGASVSLDNARRNAEHIASFMNGAIFNSKQFYHDHTRPTSEM